MERFHHLDRFHKSGLPEVDALNPRTRNCEVSDLKLKEAKESFGYIFLPNNFISIVIFKLKCLLFKKGQNEEVQVFFHH